MIFIMKIIGIEKEKKMSKTYDFFIAGRTRNKEKILEICSIFDSLKISYYCFLKNETSHAEAGLDINKNPEELMNQFENLKLESGTDTDGQRIPYALES